MILYLNDLFTRLDRFSANLDNIALLTNQHWVSIDEIAQQKVVYIFRTNNELLISRNGAVQKARWEYLGNNSLLIDTAEGSQMFKHGFFDDSILALKLDSTPDFSIFVNENKHSGELNSPEKVARFLENKYFDTKTKAQIESGTGQRLNTPKVVITKTKEEIEAQKEREKEGDSMNIAILFIFIIVFCVTIGIASQK